MDAAFIGAFGSAKNAEKKQIPEMHQAEKGGPWRFGMKCRIDADMEKRGDTPLRPPRQMETMSMFNIESSNFSPAAYPLEPLNKCAFGALLI